MKKTDWGLEIIRVGNGYKIRAASFSDLAGEDVIMEEVIQDDEQDELKSGEELLNFVKEFFGFMGSKHDRERLFVVREAGENYPIKASGAN